MSNAEGERNSVRQGVLVTCCPQCLGLRSRSVEVLPEQPESSIEVEVCHVCAVASDRSGPVVQSRSARPVGNWRDPAGTARYLDGGRFLLDWDCGLPWGAIQGQTQEVALYLARTEYEAFGDDPVVSDRIRLTRELKADEGVPPEYFPGPWRWRFPGRV